MNQMGVVSSWQPTNRTTVAAFATGRLRATYAADNAEMLVLYLPLAVLSKKSTQATETMDYYYYAPLAHQKVQQMWRSKHRVAEREEKRFRT